MQAREPLLPEKITSDNFSVSLGGYSPHEIRALSELPTKIQKKLEQHLLERFGDAYYKRLVFTGGQIVNFSELYKAEPTAKNYDWKVFAYRLTYRISEPEKGIEAYFGTIELDQKGEVQTEINLPKTRQFPQKTHFISLASAYNAAKQRGLTPAKAWLSYNRHYDSVVFHFMQEFSAAGSTFEIWNIDIDAHSGAELKNYVSQGIH
ncbi:MAG: hypothetical protein ACFUZC_23455 [Chthoniobacteraceae bacterium]